MRLALAFLVWSSLAEAQSQTLAPLNVGEATFDKAYLRARSRRNIGIGLAIPGVTSTLLGIVLIAYGANQEPYLYSEIAELVSGAITAGVGLAVGIPGVVLWSTGQDEMDVIKWRRQQLKLTLNGAALTF
jgi:hypothetical protein